jgi:hypothetical protein
MVEGQYQMDFKWFYTLNLLGLFFFYSLVLTVYGYDFNVLCSLF